MTLLSFPNKEIKHSKIWACTAQSDCMKLFIFYHTCLLDIEGNAEHKHTLSVMTDVNEVFSWSSPDNFFLCFCCVQAGIRNLSFCPHSSPCLLQLCENVRSQSQSKALYPENWSLLEAVQFSLSMSLHTPLEILTGGVKDRGKVC